MRAVRSVQAALVICLVGAWASTLFADEAMETAIKAVLDREADAFRKGDLAGVTACWEAEETSSVIESGEANWGWADYRDHHLKPELAGMKLTEYKHSNVRIVASGDMAFATLEFRIAGTYKGRTFDATGLESVVLRRRGGTWRIVHVHSSSPQKRPAAK